MGVMRDCRGVFEGVRTLVDVRGGKGGAARIICEQVPDMKCTVLDLPHVSGLEDGQNLKFVGGDMFEFIPPTDAILLKVCMQIFYFGFLHKVKCCIHNCLVGFPTAKFTFQNNLNA